MTRKLRPRPEGYDPLALAPEKAKARYAKTASRAHRQSMPAIKLKCIECCAYKHNEAKKCEIRTCALWALNRRIFAR